LAALGRSERRALAALGLRIGMIGCHLPALSDDGSARLRALLWGLRTKSKVELDSLPNTPVLVPDGEIADELLLALGYFRLETGRAGGPAVRADVLERFAVSAKRRSRKGPFEPDMAFCDILEVDAKTLCFLLHGLGYREVPGDDGRRRFAPRPRRSSTGQRQRRRGRKGKDGHDADSPFAVLARLKTAKKSR
jgi:ATP-dependent RNA helicase SUPV3L1/SUV3